MQPCLQSLNVQQLQQQLSLAETDLLNLMRSGIQKVDKMLQHLPAVLQVAKFTAVHKLPLPAHITSENTSQKMRNLQTLSLHMLSTEKKKSTPRIVHFLGQ